MRTNLTSKYQISSGFLLPLFKKNIFILRLFLDNEYKNNIKWITIVESWQGRRQKKINLESFVSTSTSIKQHIFTAT